jgi:F0F1-type ATP synthase assembly protein I
MHITASPSRVTGGAAAVVAARPLGVSLAGAPRRDSVDRRPEPSQPGAFSMVGALTGLAMLIAVLVAGSMAVGYLLDSALSTPHVFLFAGLVIGVLAAVLATRSIVKRYFGS